MYLQVERLVLKEDSIIRFYLLEMAIYLPRHSYYYLRYMSFIAVLVTIFQGSKLIYIPNNDKQNYPLALCSWPTNERIRV